jgi:hypothetical protein
MSILYSVPASELGTKYTHLGWFLGLVPVYVGDVEDECPLVQTRNLVPDFLFWAALALFTSFCWIAEALSPNFVAAFPICYTGRIDGTPLSNPDGSMR